VEFSSRRSFLHKAKLGRFRKGSRADLRIIEFSTGQAVNAVDDPVSPERHKRDALFFPGLEPNRRSGRHLKPETEGFLTIKAQGTVDFKEMAVRPDLNGPVTSVGDRHVNCLPSFERHDIALAQQHFPRDYIRRLKRSD
jgi:hypothetical protein